MSWIRRQLDWYDEQCTTLITQQVGGPEYNKELLKKRQRKIVLRKNIDDMFTSKINDNILTATECQEYTEMIRDGKQTKILWTMLNSEDNKVDNENY